MVLLSFIQLILFFAPLPNNPLSPPDLFLPLISTPIGFHDWDLVTRRAQRLITSNYSQPSTPKDWSTMRNSEPHKNSGMRYFRLESGYRPSRPCPRCRSGAWSSRRPPSPAAHARGASLGTWKKLLHYNKWGRYDK